MARAARKPAEPTARHLTAQMAWERAVVDQRNARQRMVEAHKALHEAYSDAKGPLLGGKTEQRPAPRSDLSSADMLVTVVFVITVLAIIVGVAVYRFWGGI